MKSVLGEHPEKKIEPIDSSVQRSLCLFKKNDLGAI